MDVRGTFLLTAIGIFYLAVVAKAKCPEKLPVDIEGNCYALQTELQRFGNARDNCRNQGEGARITSYRSDVVLKKLEDAINEFVTSKAERAMFWIGFKLDDDSVTKAAGDRFWRWDYDESQIVQKDYTLWYKEGGPTDKTLTCTALNASANFLVKGVDCGGPKLPVLCMMNEGETCKHDLYPYLMYGDYCIAGLNNFFEYKNIHAACHPNIPTPYKEEMRDSVMLAAKNSFLGGGLFMNMRRVGGEFYDLDDGSVPDKDMWEEGEPHGEYDCVVLSQQLDNTLKLKTINCDFVAASLCVIDGSTYDTDFPSQGYNVLPYYFYIVVRRKCTNVNRKLISRNIPSIGVLNTNTSYKLKNFIT